MVVIKKFYVRVILLILILMINGCDIANVNIEDLSYEEIINKQYSNPPLSMQVEKILWNKIINNNEVILFFLNKEHTISVSRIANVDKNWQAKVSAPIDKGTDEIISWQWSLLSNLPNEENPEVTAVVWGYIYSPEVSKVLISSDKEKKTSEEAEILKFDDNNRIFYFLTDEATGFKNDIIVAYDNSGNEVFSNSK